MINYLFSQVSKETGFSSFQKEYVLKNVVSEMNIAFIASTPDNYERSDEQISRFKKYFGDIDIIFKNIYLIDSRTTKEEAKDIINNCDIIFLLGGSPDLQMKFIDNYELGELIRTVKIIMGVSAGAMNQGSRVIYIDDYDNFELKDYPGLNFTDVNVYPHYDLNNQDCLDEVKKIASHHHVICIPNESFVYIDNGNIEIIGKYYEF